MIWYLAHSFDITDNENLFLVILFHHFLGSSVSHAYDVHPVPHAVAPLSAEVVDGVDGS